jgi:hypothetical protein
LFRVLDRGGSEQEFVNEAEDGAIRSNAQRQREDGDDSNPRVMAKGDSYALEWIRGQDSAGNAGLRHVFNARAFVIRTTPG